MSLNTRVEPEDRVFRDPPSVPTYAELINCSEFQLVICDICGDAHIPKVPCKSKPTFPPSAYFPKCPICYGYHPQGRCWFEYLRSAVLTPSFCENCQITHVGFCKEALFCQYCNTRHNFSDGCLRQVNHDLSLDHCIHCGLQHYLHCPTELQRIKTDLHLWCNRCKVAHSFMNCVPFCNRCFRKHREGPCPEKWTLCGLCKYCHQGEDCPSTSRAWNPPEPLQLFHPRSPSQSPPPRATASQARKNSKSKIKTKK